MTKIEYLNQLDTYLTKLPQSDRIEAMDYFKELSDDAGPEREEELMASLGSPKEAAHDILTSLLDKKLNDETPRKNRVQILWIALLALLAAPVGLPIILAILATCIGLLIAVVGFILGLAGIALGGFVIGLIFSVESFTVLLASKSSFLLLLGGGLLSIGASSLALLGMGYVARFGGLLIIRLVQWILKKTKRGEQDEQMV